jgi:prepilin-type N-terminal cleavage/methylation domain-containing protein
MITSTPSRTSYVKAFTLIELLISISIFAFMTAFLLAKYGTFNQSVLLTNLAYDTALTIRSAQSYGLDVQGQASSSGISFNYAYGVHFTPATASKFIFFVDLCGDGIYQATTCKNSAPAGNETISTYNVRTDFTISSLCAGTSAAICVPVTGTNSLDILFKRPNPDAIITTNFAGALLLWPYAKIGMKATDGSMKSVVVQSTGQISVTN